jgi:HPt (histidine-containing phosphotransfer) domain-containing protein
MRVLVAEHLEDDCFLLRAYCKGTALAVIREIRRVEQERGAKRIPILALITKALAADVARAQEAGCDAHLVKPVSKSVFLSALNQWQPIPADAAAAKSTVVIQIPEGMEQLARNYLAARRKEAPVFEDFLEHSDFDSIRRLAHNLKGTGASYGFPDITRLGAAAERAAKESDKPEVSKQMADLFAYVESASRQLP